MKVGDKVIIEREATFDDWGGVWLKEMDDTIGSIYIITNYEPKSYDNVPRIRLDDRYWYPGNVLKVINREEKLKRILK